MCFEAFIMFGSLVMWGVSEVLPFYKKMDANGVLHHLVIKILKSECWKKRQSQNTEQEIPDVPPSVSV